MIPLTRGDYDQYSPTEVWAARVCRSLLLPLHALGVQTALLPTSDRAAVGGAVLWSIAFTGSGFSAVLSSSCMPFLKALMPCATSPMRSEILPRPNSSRTTAITTIQCQMLSEPILRPSEHETGMNPAQSEAESRLGRCQKQGLRRREIPARQLTACFGKPMTVSGSKYEPASSPRLGFRRRCQRQFKVADLERVFVVAQRRIVRGDRNAEAGRQP